ncbi:hypothetical protein ILUMI_18723, partial [Ignelater luminosus]
TLLKDGEQSQFEVCWECLKLKFDELPLRDNEVYQGLLETATEEQLLAEMDGCDAYVKRFTELRLKCEKLLGMDRAEEASSVTSRSVRSMGDDVPSTGLAGVLVPVQKDP